MKKELPPNRVITIEMTEEAYRELYVGLRTRNIMGSISFMSPVDNFADLVGRAIYAKTERLLIKSLLFAGETPPEKKPKSKKPSRRKK